MAAPGASPATRPASPRSSCGPRRRPSPKRPDRSPPERAFDELRFGPQRTLNLREGLPAAADAVRRAENWLREHQVRRSGEVLIITGRGNQSPDGVGVIRQEVEKLLFSLRRRGVITGHQEHNPGAFVVQLAPLRALVDAPRRNRDRREAQRRPALPGLSETANEALRALAERSLEALGVRPDDARVLDEMHRHLRALVPGLAGGPGMETVLLAALRAALEEYD